MSDTTLNAFVASGTAAERAAFTPTPPTPSSGPDSGYFFFETDTGLTYSWNGAIWVQTGGGGANSVTAAGTLTSGSLVIGQGTKAVAVTTTGTGIVTALGVNVGSAGAPVLFNGALGTPSSGTMTSVTGLPLTTGVTGVLPVANGGTGSASGATILRATGTINNTNYAALPTATQTLIAAPGSGFRINLISAYLLADFAAGAYTGASVASSWLVLRIGSTGASSYIANSNTASTPLTYLTVFNNATKKSAVLVPWMDTSDTSEAWGLITPVVTNYTGDNSALTIVIENAGVNLGGGHASNSLDWSVLYTLESTT